MNPKCPSIYTRRECDIQLSILMAVYQGNEPDPLDRAIGSVLGQSVKAAQIVLVKDGELTPELDAIVEKWGHLEPDILDVVSLRPAVGLGEALRIGALQCRHEFIARMDADDVSMPDRFQNQLDFLKKHPDVDVVGAWVGEFQEHPARIIHVRSTPLSSTNVARYARWRNPVNHPTAIITKRTLEKVGGYESFEYFEDYYLWARIIAAGGRIANLPEILVKQQISREFFRRRGGWKYLRSEIDLQRRFLRMGFVRWHEFARNIVMRVAVRVCPISLRWALYRTFLRKDKNHCVRVSADDAKSVEEGGRGDHELRPRL